MKRDEEGKGRGRRKGRAEQTWWRSGALREATVAGSAAVSARAHAREQDSTEGGEVFVSSDQLASDPRAPTRTQGGGRGGDFVCFRHRLLKKKQTLSL